MEAVVSDRVRSYFDGAANSFDSIYRSDKSLAQKLVDSLFHGVVHRRYELTFELCGEDQPVSGRLILAAAQVATRSSWPDGGPKWSVWISLRPWSSWRANWLRRLGWLSAVILSNVIFSVGVSPITSIFV